MSLGKRKAKLVRAHLRPTHLVVHPQSRSARQRDRWARLAVVAVAVLATAAIVHGSGPFFTFRLGQRPDREVRVNVDQFQRRNMIRTNIDRQAKADQVPPAMVNNPLPIEDLAARLDDLVVTVARSPTFDSLPDSIRGLWKLSPSLFEDIREASDNPDRLDRASVVGVARPPSGRWFAHGILGPDTLPTERRAEAGRCRVRSDNDQPIKTRPRSSTRDRDPSRTGQASSTGPVCLGLQVAAFNSPTTLGERLFRADCQPTRRRPRP